MRITHTKAAKFSVTPEELEEELIKRTNELVIGIPKEEQECEKRLVLTPEAVDMIVDAGHRVVFEEGAGLGINYADNKYAEAGAEIVSSKSDVFRCDLIFKIAPPTMEEISLMKTKATLFSMLEITGFSVDIIQAMSAKKINAAGYELITSDGRTFPVRDSISEIEGAASVSVASELLSNSNGGKGILMGGVPGVSPTEVLIIGAGVGGTIAARAAMGLGAVVKVFDNNINKLRRLQDTLGRTVFTSVFQPNVLVNAFKSADVVIGAMRYINSPYRYVISEELIKTMKSGALIVDLRTNQGGCFETTCFLPKGHPLIFDKYGVTHYCVPNLSSKFARTTSMALSNIFTPFILRMGEFGGISGIAKSDMEFRSGLYLYGGKLVNAYVANSFNMPYNDIGLFLSVY